MAMATHGDEIVDFEPLQIPRATVYLNDPKLRKDAGYCGPEYRNFECKMCDWFTLSPADGDFYRGHDKKMLRFLRVPSDPRHANFDLNIEHEEDAQELRFEKNNKMDTFFQFIMSEAQKNARCCEILKRRDQIICPVNTLKIIMHLPLKRVDGYGGLKAFSIEINVVKIGHTFYMTNNEVEENGGADVEQSVNSEEPAHIKCSKQGLKFEHYMFADEEPHPEKPVLQKRIALRLVCEATFAGHHLLYTCKQKGLEGHPDLLDNLPIATFLMCTTKPIWRGQNYSWERLLFWWEKSILMKAQKCIVGHRQENGMVQYIDIVPTQGLLTEAAKEYLKKNPRTNVYQDTSGQSLGRGVFASNWRTGQPVQPSNPKPADAASELANIITDMNFGFLARFLDYLKATLPQGVGEGPDVVYQFSWHPDREDLVTCRKLTGEAGEAARFIPDWYMAHLQLNAGLMPA
ncbi:hypothetical protein B566_EDAN015159 [Ephemera danica]|nr:hypothetical protein B566_EDAN015159 [Ephemera danica]